MGSGQSVRATHFQRQGQPPPPADTSEEPEEDDQHQISISNKMVERLVEDATLAGGAATAGMGGTPRGDFKDKIYMEKLKCMDENHSEKFGLTFEDLNTMTKRIELRTATMVSVEPVCVECKQSVIDCYQQCASPAEVVNCWDTVGAFAQCVHSAAAARLQARTARQAREHARRDRHVAHARGHALRDLAGGGGTKPAPAPEDGDGFADMYQ